MVTKKGSSAGGSDAPTRGKDTAQRILDVAERLVQHRGFNAFSYADIAEELGITKASVHHHFAGKAELGEALISRYASTFAASLAAIDDEVPGAPAKLRAYTCLYADVLRHRRMCLCGMLAAEYQALPKAICDAIIVFFEDNETWLKGVLQQGRAERTLSFQGAPKEMARVLVSGLEGAMLVARLHAEPSYLQAVAASLLAGLRRRADEV